MPKNNLSQESPINKEQLFVNKYSKLANYSYPFMDPLPKDMTDCRPWQFKDTPIDWRMLTSSRPQTKKDEELFTRIVEMSRLQHSTKITTDEENRLKLVPLTKQNRRLYIEESESSENEIVNKSFDDFARNDNTGSMRDKCYGGKVLSSEELVDRLSELMSGKQVQGKTMTISEKKGRAKTKTISKKKQPRNKILENACSSKDNSCSEETDLGSSESIPTPPIFTPKPKKIFTKRVRNKTRSSKSALDVKSDLPKLERRGSHNFTERSLPKLERPPTVKQDKRNKVIYIRLPQIGN